MIRHFYISLLVVFFASCQSNSPSPTPSKNPHLLAHRGLSRHAPENTLPAFAAAIDLGLDIEVDVFQTLDEHIVVIHDDTLDRTTNGTGKVVEKTLDEIRLLDAGFWFTPIYQGLKVPTLDEVLQMVKNNQWRQTKIAINMKVISPGIEERIVRLVEKHEMMEQVFAFGMKFESAKRFRKANPEFPISVPGWSWDKNGDRKPTLKEVESAHAQGKKVWVISSCINYVPDCWANTKQIGVDGFLTNFPLEAREQWRQSKHLTYPNKQNTIPPKTGPDRRLPSYKPEILAHRGLEMHLPENTLPALAAAASLGFGVEFNVQLTKDTQLVVIQDETVDRTTNGTGKVSDKTLVELRELDAGSWFDPIFKGFKIPTLEEALTTISNRQWRPVLVGIHLQNTTKEIEEQIINLVEKHKMIEQVFVFGVDEKSVKHFHEANPAFVFAMDDDLSKPFTQTLKNEEYQVIRSSNQWWLRAEKSAYIKKELVDAFTKKGQKLHLVATIQNFKKNQYQKEHLLAWEHALIIGASSICVSHPLELRKFWNVD